MTAPLDSSSGASSGNWLFKNKEHGKTSAAASLVCIILLNYLFSLCMECITCVYKYFIHNRV